MTDATHFASVLRGLVVQWHEAGVSYPEIAAALRDEAKRAERQMGAMPSWLAAMVRRWR